MPTRNGSVHVATTTRNYKNKVYRTHSLRRTCLDGGKVKHQTLGNLSHLPPDLIDTIGRRLGGEPPEDGGHWETVRSLPHGHVVAVLRTIQRIGPENVLASRPSRQRALALALIVARILKPGSKLSTTRALRQETATTSGTCGNGSHRFCLTITNAPRTAPSSIFSPSQRPSSNGSSRYWKPYRSQNPRESIHT